MKRDTMDAIEERTPAQRQSETGDDDTGRHWDQEKFMKALDAAFGTWPEKGADGLEVQRRLRDEWA